MTGTNAHKSKIKTEKIIATTLLNLTQTQREQQLKDGVGNDNNATET